MKRDVRIMLGVEKVLAFQLVALHAAPGVNGVCINLDVEYS
jgi:hypothetical protein